VAPVHFYTEPEVSSAEILAWDPDAEPARFASGLGHNLLELFVRMRALGLPVTVGHRIPPLAKVVVVFPRPVLGSVRRHVRMGWTLRRLRTVLIRSDLTPRQVHVIRSDVQVAPNDALITRDRRRTWVSLPPLPQRGLLPRRVDRGDRLETLAFKGNPENIPAYLSDANFRGAVARLGFELVIDAPKQTDGSDQQWHDFSGVDACILDRTHHHGADIWGKPPTRLLNAWHAGVIPLAAPEPAYLELAEDRHDAVFFTSGQELLDLLISLAGHPEEVARLRAGVMAAQARLGSNDAVVMQYWDLTQSLGAELGFRETVSAAVTLARGVGQAVRLRGESSLRRRFVAGRRVE
jgi:hypothetical protein